jgi:hypothetical protein
VDPGLLVAERAKPPPRHGNPRVEAVRCEIERSRVSASRRRGDRSARVASPCQQSTNAGSASAAGLSDSAARSVPPIDAVSSSQVHGGSSPSIDQSSGLEHVARRRLRGEVAASGGEKLAMAAWRASR